MIIRFPTGLYRNVIPKSLSDTGNVTFVISNSSPPRSNLLFPKIPLAIAVKKKQPKSFDQRRRAAVGDLLFSVSTARRSDLGNGNSARTIGEVLEFTDTQLDTPVVMLVGPTTSIQHNLGTIDYSRLGISDTEQTAIGLAATTVQATLTGKLNSLKQNRANAESDLVTNQKIVNDLDRTIAALQTANLYSPSTEINVLLEKLAAKRAEATVAIAAALAAAEDYANTAAEIQRQLQQISVVLT